MPDFVKSFGHTHCKVYKSKFKFCFQASCDVIVVLALSYCSNLQVYKLLQIFPMPASTLFLERVPATPLPNGIPEIIIFLIQLLLSTNLLEYIILWQGILTLVNLGVIFCGNCSFIPLNVSLNMLTKGTRYNYRSLLFLITYNLHHTAFLALCSNEVGSVVYFLDKYPILDLL